jgi:L-amino acid N-acyltransferase YncA
MGQKDSPNRTSLIMAPRSECTVRPAKAEDMAAVTAIYAHFVETSTATFELVAPGEATMRRRFQSVL